MPGTAKRWLGWLALAAGLVAPPQNPPDQPAGPPPMRIPFERVQAQATFDIAAVMSIGASTDFIWAVRQTPPAVLRIDPGENTVGPDIVLPSPPCGGAAAGFDAVWVPLCGEAALARIDAKTSEVVVEPMPAAGAAVRSIATGIGSIWLLADDGLLLRVDPATRKPVADLHLPSSASALAFGMGALWVAGGDANRAVRVNPHTNVLEKAIPAGHTMRGIAVGEDAVWALSEGDGKVLRIDPEGNRIAATIELGVSAAGGSIAAGAGSVWVSAPDAPLVRIDAKTNRVAQLFSGSGGGGPLVVAHRSIWMTPSGDTVRRVDPRFVEALRPQDQAR